MFTNKNLNIFQYFRNIKKDDPAALVFVFIVYFFFAKFALDLYYAFSTSPALIWPPVGIALVAVIFGGYRMWFPIFLAQFLVVVLRSPSAYQIAFILALAYALQAVVALYILRRLKFESSLKKFRDMVIFVGVAFFATLIEPTISTLSQAIWFSLAVTPLVNLGRAWGAGIFSVLVITPFVLMWWGKEGKHVRLTRIQNIEVGLAFALLFTMNHFLFWTTYPQYFGISVIFFLPLVLVWFGLRLHPRWLTLAVVVTSIYGITGTLLAHPGIAPLNEQLLTDEVYLGFVSAIFLVFVAVVEDRRAAHLRLEKMYTTTVAADKAKSQFIAILAHELRNPLAPIVTSLELLKLQSQAGESLEVILSIEKHTTMIRRLLDDLLDTARLSQNKFQLQKEVVNLHDIIVQSIESIKDLSDSRRHTLRVVLPEEDIEFFADPVRIKQIIINLLNNASKFTPPGGKIVITAEQEKNDLVIRIADNGIGVASDMIENIFAPFEQLDTRHNSGLGIGLFLTKRLTEMHGGAIEVKSDGEGTGSVFTVRLPLRSPRTFLSAEKKGGEKSLDARRILIVDDNEAAADILQKLLQYHGHNVAVAYSGKQALEMVKSAPPEVIFLDIGMPHMDGYEVAQELASLGWTGTLVALTGYGQNTDRTKVYETGFDHHLIKPISAADLVAVLAKVKVSE